jgi:hypothetical protein
MALASEQPAVPCPAHQIPQGGRSHDWPILADEPRDVIQAAAKAGQMRFCFSFPFRDDFIGFVRLGFMHLHKF